MNRIFYDHLVALSEVDVHIKSVAVSSEEKEELWKIVDETVHARVITTILDNLPKKHHAEFLDKFHKAPHDEKLIAFINEKTKKDVEAIISQEIKALEKELLETL